MLNAITIENFQSLRDPVSVPLAPITLLYGPNSAGKSAVLDALSFLDAVFRADDATLCTLVMRHTHQPQPGVEKAAIRLRAQGYAVLADHLGSSGPALHRLYHNSASDLNFDAPGGVMTEGYGEAYLEWDVECFSDLGVLSNPIRRLSMDVNGHPTLTLEWADVDLLDVELSIDPVVFGPYLSELAEQCGVATNAHGGFSTSVWVDLEPLRVHVNNVGGNEDEQFLQTLASLANWLLGRSAEVLAVPRVVPADRGVIADHDLVVFARKPTGFTRGSRFGLPASFTSLPERDLLSQAATGSSESRVIQQLALSRAGLEPSGGFGISLGTHASERSDIFVNRCLADHLFLDLGYQVQFDVLQVLPASGSLAADMPKAKRPTAAVVLCSLTDRANRRLTFQDVGTGISCVLPVLGAMHSGFSFIQQPELHLHPALQASLADVAVEAANRPAQSGVQRSAAQTELGILPRGHVLHILETHSEYLLLRCLKRLRQTAQGLHPENSPQRLTPEQLSVLYFDPRPDGTTCVRRIRVTEDGEFIDRWPRGFFEERGQELFDE